MGGAAAVAGPEVGHKAESLMPEGFCDAAFESFVREGPDDFGELAMLQEIVDVPMELLMPTEVAVDPGRNAAQGGADIGVAAIGEVDCAQASDFDGLRGFEADEEDVGAGSDG